MNGRPAPHDVALVDVLDRLLAGGVVLTLICSITGTGTESPATESPATESPDPARNP
jgi:hypothetical protein